MTGETIHISLEPNDARIVSAMLLLSTAVLTDVGLLAATPFIADEQVSAIMAHTLQLLSGATPENPTMNLFEEESEKVITMNLKRITALIKSNLIATDRGEIEKYAPEWLKGAKK